MLAKIPLKFVLTIFVSALAIFFTRVLFFDFANYDDNVYVTENEFIKTFTLENLRYIFTHQFHGHFFPITLLSYSIEHFFFGLNPGVFHLTNIVFHLLSTLLVYYFLTYLGFNFWQSLFGAAVFSIHPMQLESVVWIGARNNMLFGFFFLASLLTYTLYVKQPSNKSKLVFAFLLFLFACLSKSVSVVLPVILLIIDWFENRKLKFSVFLEKIPFFIISAIIAYIASYAANQWGSVEPIAQKFSLDQRPFLISYPIVVYLTKFIAPVFLKINYPNPEVINGLLPPTYYFSLLGLLLVLGVMVWGYLKNFKVLVFGLLFFLINIGLYLKVFFSTNVMLAERYVYLAYLGPIVVLLWLTNKVIKNKGYLFSLFGIWLLLLGTLSQLRMNVWKNGEELFSDLIGNNQERSASYLYRGVDLYQKGKYDEALLDLNKAVQLDSTKATVYNARGFLFMLRKENNLAEIDFKKALSIDSTYGFAYFNLGNIYGAKNDLETAKKYFTKFLLFEPNNEEAYFKLGNIAASVENYEEALTNYSQAIKLKPTFMEAFMNRGSVYFTLEEKALACSDWIMANKLGNEDALIRIRKYCN